MKTLVLVLLFVMASLFISGVTGHDSQTMASTTIQVQDTTKKKLTDTQKKEIEVKDKMIRSKGLELNMMKQEKMIEEMDSLMGKIDTTKIKK